jgi:hypothetical protein
MTLAAGCLMGCTSSICKGKGLGRATTATAESAAMIPVWAECAPVSISAYDATGPRVPFSDPNWPQRGHRLEMSLEGGPAFSHQVIDRTNVTLRMGE